MVMCIHTLYNSFRVTTLLSTLLNLNKGIVSLIHKKKPSYKIHKVHEFTLQLHRTINFLQLINHHVQQ